MPQLLVNANVSWKVREGRGARATNWIFRDSAGLEDDKNGSQRRPKSRIDRELYEGETADRPTGLARLCAVSRESGLVHMLEMHNTGKIPLNLMRLQPLAFDETAEFWEQL